MEDNDGAKTATDGNTYDILDSSPEVPFLANNVVHKYVLEVLANLVTSHGCATVQSFLWWVVNRTRQNQYEECIFTN